MVLCMFILAVVAFNPSGLLMNHVHPKVFDYGNADGKAMARVVLGYFNDEAVGWRDGVPLCLAVGSFLDREHCPLSPVLEEGALFQSSSDKYQELVVSYASSF